jgi:hypothetical protein
MDFPGALEKGILQNSLFGYNQQCDVWALSHRMKLVPFK